MKTKLEFFKQDGRWYADVPEHTLDENEMILGSDEFLEKISRGNERIAMEFSTDSADSYLVKLSMSSHDEDGAEYLMSGPFIDAIEEGGVTLPLTIWICNVTHTVLGEHPDVIYITRFFDTYIGV